MVAGALLLAACAAGDAPPTFIIDRSVAPQREAVNLTLEEAGFLATGQLIEIYGVAADPVPQSVEGEVVDLDGQRVWRLDIVVELTVDGQRVRHDWRMWIGTPSEGDPTALRAQRRS